MATTTIFMMVIKVIKLKPKERRGHGSDSSCQQIFYDLSNTIHGRTTRSVRNEGHFREDWIMSPPPPLPAIRGGRGPRWANEGDFFYRAKNQWTDSLVRGHGKAWPRTTTKTLICEISVLDKKSSE